MDGVTTKIAESRLEIYIIWTWCCKGKWGSSESVYLLTYLFVYYTLMATCSLLMILVCCYAIDLRHLAESRFLSLSPHPRLWKNQKANISDSNSWRGSAKLYTILNTENDGFVFYGLINRLSSSDQHQSSYPTCIVLWKLIPKFIFDICYKVGQSILTRQMGRTFQQS